MRNRTILYLKKMVKRELKRIQTKLKLTVIIIICCRIHSNIPRTIIITQWWHANTAVAAAEVQSASASYRKQTANQKKTKFIFIAVSMWFFHQTFYRFHICLALVFAGHFLFHPIADIIVWFKYTQRAQNTNNPKWVQHKKKREHLYPRHIEHVGGGHLQWMKFRLCVCRISMHLLSRIMMQIERSFALFAVFHYFSIDLQLVVWFYFPFFFFKINVPFAKICIKSEWVWENDSDQRP